MLAARRSPLVRWYGSFPCFGGTDPLRSVVLFYYQNKLVQLAVGLLCAR